MVLDLYVDSLLNMLIKSNYGGCHKGGVYYGVLSYADYIIILVYVLCK